MRDPKTRDQLRYEIAYFASVLHRTTSRDRRRRAHRALAQRQQLLLAGVHEFPNRRPRSRT